jgi:tight adherence protein C
MAAKFLVAGLAVLLVLLLLKGDPSTKNIWLSCAVTVVAYFVPDLLIYSRGQERQAAIALELPDTLDQMTIAVEAGLGFDAAMSRTGHNGKGPLARELVRTLQDMQIGMSRREAYTALADRTGAPDLRRFVNAILQADKYGISISAVLRTQASEMRSKRRQRAEEKAMKIPVKVLFPLMLFILPVLFIAMLGPAAINVIDTLGKL